MEDKLEMAEEAYGKLGAIMERCEKDTLNPNLWFHRDGLYAWYLERVDPDGAVHGAINRRDDGNTRKGVFTISPDGTISTNVEAFQLFDELV